MSAISLPWLQRKGCPLSLPFSPVRLLFGAVFAPSKLPLMFISSGWFRARWPSWIFLLKSQGGKAPSPFRTKIQYRRTARTAPLQWGGQGLSRPSTTERPTTASSRGATSPVPSRRQRLGPVSPPRRDGVCLRGSVSWGFAMTL